AIQTTRSGRIGIIGTKSTIHSGAYQSHLLERKTSLHVVAQACPLFVPLVEEGLEDDPITEGIVHRYLTPMMEENLDTVILGCTHYPLIINQIKKYLPEQVHLLSQGSIVAKSLTDYLLRHPDLEKKCSKHGRIEFYTTDQTSAFDKAATLFYGQNINSKHLAL
ncbi:MAG TPA: aspartate/glutamate racemase family protein, partial [Bacteroidia bacterium]|nr:aspartate/glutamate racemase family protein [Bacteroidia bacterium]